MAGVVLGLVAVIIPWWAMGASTPPESPNRPQIHPRSGLLLTVYSVLQVLLGALRPPAAKDGEEPSSKRRCWEKVHKYSGRVAMLVALWQLATGAWIAADFIGPESRGQRAGWLGCLGVVLLLNIGAGVRLSVRKEVKAQEGP